MVDAPMEVDRATLLPIVREATGRPHLEPGSWSVQRLQGGSGRSPGIWRVSGDADDGGPVAWSLVVKVLAREDGAEAPDSWNYWRREADAYESGVLDDLPGRIRAPRCFAAREIDPGLVGLWLEDVPGADDTWSAADTVAVARDLGELGGGLDITGVRGHSWLSRDWLRRYLEHNVPFVDLLQRSADDRWVRRMFPPDELRTVVDLWNDRARHLDLLSRLPQTFCHMDAFSRNLFRCGERGERSVVAIDWAFVGSGAVGEELAPLVVVGVTLGGVDADVAELENRVVDAYVEGLARAGVECHPRLARLGYALAAPLRYVIGPLELLLPILLDEGRHPWFEELHGKPMTEICDQFVALRRTVLWPLVAEARVLEDELRVR